MTTFTMHAAKTNLSKLIAEAEAGIEVVILRGAKPVVRLVAIGEDAQRPRIFGALAGQVRVGDDIDVPLSDAELAAWDE
jgi:antitoxin (DNA-binding transcriptional repressor) of toxin-antitoxin stability system